MASIGLTENAAKAKNLPIRIGKFSLTANGKALAIEMRQVSLKRWYMQKRVNYLAHMVGHEVTEHIQGFAIAKYLEATDESLARDFPASNIIEAMHESIWLQCNERFICRNSTFTGVEHGLRD